MVLELPPGPYIGLANDHYQNWIIDFGMPGADGGKGGKYLLLPPNDAGAVPDFYHVGRASSYKLLVAMRALPVGGDVPRALAALGALRLYPLADEANPQPMKIVDSTTSGMDSTCLAWEDNIKFWEQLDRIIQDEPLNPQFTPLYGLLGTFGIEKGKHFAPDARLQAILRQAARDGRDQMLVSAFASRRPDRLAWPDRKWEWVGLVTDNAGFEEPGGIDMVARDRWFVQAIATSPAMFRRKPGAGSRQCIGGSPFRPRRPGRQGGAMDQDRPRTRLVRLHSPVRA